MANGEGAGRGRWTRVAEAALRTNGGRVVMLRMPSPAASGSAAEELGLATPEFQDVLLGPAVFRKAESLTKLLVSGEAVRALVGSLAFDSADVLFEAAAGVVVDGLVLEITNSVAMSAGGEDYCWCLTLRVPER
jgi:hypothetical protein